MDKSGKNFASAMERLNEINEWFQQEDIDLDEGLKKLKEGKELIRQCREKLKNVENEFLDIKKDILG